MNPQIALAAIKFFSSPSGQKILASTGGGSPATSDINAVASALGGGSVPQGGDFGKGSIRAGIMDSPKQLGIKTGLSLATETARGVGKITEAKANRLASAILSANRVNSAKQNEIYGPSGIEKAAEVLASKKAYEGIRNKAIADGFVNVFDRILRTYDTQDNAAKMLETGQDMRVPGALYTYLNGESGRRIRGGQ